MKSTIGVKCLALLLVSLILGCDGSLIRDVKLRLLNPPAGESSTPIDVSLITSQVDTIALANGFARITPDDGSGLLAQWHRPVQLGQAQSWIDIWLSRKNNEVLISISLWLGGRECPEMQKVRRDIVRQMAKSDQVVVIETGEHE